MDPRQLNPNEGRKLNRPTKVQDRVQGGVVDAMAVAERRGMEAAEAGLRNIRARGKNQMTDRGLAAVIVHSCRGKARCT